MEIHFIDTEDPLYEKERSLRSKELREPLGFPSGAEVFPFENESLHLVAIEDGEFIGCALFHPEGKSGRLYQMAVAEGRRREGVGKGLVIALEEHLTKEGFEEIYLHSRDIAVSFYEKMGYIVAGKPFVEIGIKHWMMKKSLLGED